MAWRKASICGVGHSRQGKLPAETPVTLAAEALRIGLVSKVFPDASFRTEVNALVSRLAEAAPIALRTMKSNFLAAEKVDFAAYLALESARHLPMFNLHDTKEAFAAKVEKRKPRFIGK